MELLNGVICCQHTLSPIHDLGEQMSEDRSYKTLKYMTNHFQNIKLMSFTTFHTSLNDLSIMANGGSLEGMRDQMYPEDMHTDQFFVDLLHNLGYDKDGCPLDI